MQGTGKNDKISVVAEIDATTKPKLQGVTIGLRPTLYDYTERKLEHEHYL